MSIRRPLQCKLTSPLRMSLLIPTLFPPISRSGTPCLLLSQKWRLLPNQHPLSFTGLTSCPYHLIWTKSHISPLLHTRSAMTLSLKTQKCQSLTPNPSHSWLSPIVNRYQDLDLVFTFLCHLIRTMRTCRTYSLTQTARAPSIEHHLWNLATPLGEGICKLWDLLPNTIIHNLASPELPISLHSQDATLSADRIIPAEDLVYKHTYPNVNTAAYACQPTPNHMDTALDFEVPTTKVCPSTPPKSNRKGKKHAGALSPFILPSPLQMCASQLYITGSQPIIVILSSTPNFPKDSQNFVKHSGIPNPVDTLNQYLNIQHLYAEALDILPVMPNVLRSSLPDTRPLLQASSTDKPPKKWQLPQNSLCLVPSRTQHWLRVSLNKWWRWLFLMPLPIKSLNFFKKTLRSTPSGHGVISTHWSKVVTLLPSNSPMCQTKTHQLQSSALF